MQSANGARRGRRLPFGRRETVAAATVSILAIVALAAIVGRSVFAGPPASPTSTDQQLAGASTSPSTPTKAPLAPTSSIAPSLAALSRLSPSMTTVAPTATAGAPLPYLLAAIGDSYSQAYSVSPSYPNDHTGFSWVVGSARGDGVFSLYERFKALGSSLVIVDAATSGRKMNDAPRQAKFVVAQAKMLKPDQTAYVTFELGTNDLCDDPKTDPLVFQQDLATAISALRAGLPAGSRILMLPVPNFRHFRDITQADTTARSNLALFQNSRRCAPYLGNDSPSTLAEADSYLAQYNSALKQACREIAATDGPSGKLYCTYNAALLADTDFRIADLSTYDYFHPSLSGQARMATNAWAADVWTAVPIPKGAAQ